MISLSNRITDAEVQIAADYFAGLKPRANLEVIETDSVPKTFVAGWFLADAKAGENEAIEGRIIEVPENLQQFENRDGRSRFIVYVPIGSIEKGKALATGDTGQTVQCGICHGSDLKGIEKFPELLVAPKLCRSSTVRPLARGACGN